MLGSRAESDLADEAYMAVAFGVRVGKELAPAGDSTGRAPVPAIPVDEGDPGRSLALAVIAAVCTATALLSNLYDIDNVLFRLGWDAPGSDWSPTSLPNVLLPAPVLPAAGAGAFAAQRRHRTGT